ncbi:hypothetical protein SDC9_202778 [bioreactor metagenome]|uniref:Uncharacterized protein n=1 Tax=bioreactor metagenome TaxID=1076179 RepID=A0A645IXD2_9ZZZZ
MHDAFNNKMLYSIIACDEFCNFMKQNYPDCDKEISYRKAKTATILLERISFSNNASEYKEITSSMKKAIKAELMTVILDANVQLAQKIKMICGANSIMLLRIASDIYEKLYFIYDKISISKKPK